MSLPNESLSELYSHFNELRHQAKFYDVVIRVGERYFPCHRIILTSASRYFERIFSKPFAEGERQEVELRGIDADDFEILLSYIYGREIKLEVTNIYSLLKLSHFLGPQNLENLCTSYIGLMSSSIPLNVSLQIFMFACTTKKTILIDKLLARISQNFIEISKCEKFFSTPGNELLKILSHPNLDKKDPGAILDFFVNWVKTQREEGKKFLPDLLNAVNLRQVPKDWLMKVLTSNAVLPSISEDKEEHLKGAQGRFEERDESGVLTKQISEPTFKPYAGSNSNEMLDTRAPEKKRKLPFLVFTRDVQIEQGNSTSHYCINTYELVSKNQQHCPQFVDTLRDNLVISPALRCKSVSVDKLRFTLICTGGYDVTDNEISRTCNSKFSSKAVPKKYCFEFHLRHISYSKKWTSLKTHELFSVRGIEDIAVAANGTDIYVYNEDEFVLYNSQRNQWINIVANNCVKTVSPNLLSFENNLYLIGGKFSFYAKTISNSADLSLNKKDGKVFQRFDPRVGKWCELPQMTYARSQSASCVYNDILYVTGGDDLAYYKGYIECYDFRAGKWGTFETCMHTPKMNHVLIAYDDQLWFFGGQTHTHYPIPVPDLTWYFYDLKKHTWSETFSMSSNSNNNNKHCEILDVVADL